MVWHDFTDLVTAHFNMAPFVTARFFAVVTGAVVKGVPQPPTYNEIVFSSYSIVPQQRKDRRDQLPADQRERDTLLLWTPDPALARLTTVKLVGYQNAGRVLDVQRGKWYVALEEYDYGRQGNLSGVILELYDGPPPELPDPP